MLSVACSDFQWLCGLDNDVDAGFLPRWRLGAELEIYPDVNAFFGAQIALDFHFFLPADSRSRCCSNHHTKLADVKPLLRPKALPMLRSRSRPGGYKPSQLSLAIEP